MKNEKMDPHLISLEPWEINSMVRKWVSEGTRAEKKVFRALLRPLITKHKNSRDRVELELLSLKYLPKEKRK